MKVKKLKNEVIIYEDITMYKKGKNTNFYPVKDIEGKWTIVRCEEYRKKNIK